MPDKLLKVNKMKYSKILSLIILLMLFLTSACQTTSNEEETDYVPGDVIIHLENAVQESDIKPRIEELELKWVEYFEHLGAAHIRVPIGEEKMWVKKLKEEPLIKNANLNRKAQYRGSN